MYEIIGAIITVVLLILSSYFGTKYRKFKRKLLIIAELLQEINEALADEKVTKEEVKGIAEKAAELIADP